MADCHQLRYNANNGFQFTLSHVATKIWFKAFYLRRAAGLAGLRAPLSSLRLSRSEKGVVNK